MMLSDVVLVKNMVCNRCITAVENILRTLGIAFDKVLFGEIHLDGPLVDGQQAALQATLKKIGFELIDNRTGALVESVKQHIIKKARNGLDEKEARLKLSDYLSSHLHLEYTYLSGLFSSVEGRTIENYCIEQRIEYVKELLVYGEMTLSQIALELDYSSTAHLSAQFKKVTGLTPSYFKEVGAARRRAIDEV